MNKNKNEVAESISDVASAIDNLSYEPPIDHSGAIVYVGDMISDVANAIRYLADSIKKD